MTLELGFRELLVIKTAVNNEMSFVFSLRRDNIIAEETFKSVIGNLDEINGKLNELLYREC